MTVVDRTLGRALAASGPVLGGAVGLTGRALDVGERLTAARRARLPRGRTVDPRRFAGLPDWPYEPRWVTVQPGGHRMAYVEAGPPDGPVAWLQHGNPAWGYYFRAAIAPLAAAGFRVVVPDLVGFGRSDRPTSRAAHTYAHHEAWLRSFVEQLDLRDVHAHLHDWGGLLGLRLVAFSPERFRRVLVSNTALPLGDGGPVPPLFRAWQLAAQVLPTFGRVIDQQSRRKLPPSVIAAYDAPFPSHASALGPRQLPLRVPLRVGDEGADRNRAAMTALRRFDKPFLTAFSDPDDITTGAAELFRRHVPGADPGVVGGPHPTFPGTLHYLMEDVPDELVALMLAFFRGAPLPADTGS